MGAITEIVALDTKEGFEVLDVTDRVDKLVVASHVEAGTVILFAMGATVGLTTVEYEPGLVADLEELFDLVAPADKYYKHNERWPDGNGHSHVRASLVGPSLTVPIVNSRMTLGQWQQIVLLDFDVRARHREIICQIVDGTDP